MSVGSEDIPMEERLVYRQGEQGSFMGDCEEDEETNSGTRKKRSSELSRAAKRSLSNPDEVDSSPNLHRLGELFLVGNTQKIIFMISVFLHFASTLISYTLAGSEAYAQIFHVNYYYVIPFFSFVFTLAILFAKNYIEQIVSVLTFFKGSLLIFTVVITFYVGMLVKVESESDWTHIGDPFLLGTVALGGVVNVMPMLFAHVPQREYEVRVFRRGIVLGTITCFILNILWCYSVLEVVPQCNESEVDEGMDCSISLAKSEEEGEIATVPLTQIMNRDHKEFSWISTVLTYFITLSVTVSFMTMGSAFRHALEGSIHAIMRSIHHPASTFQVKLVTSIPRCLRSGYMVKFVMFGGSFGFIFIFSMLDPKGFLQVLEKATSMALNLESGVFVILMLRRSRSHDFDYLPQVPLPISTWVYKANLFVMSYFLFAVLYDLVVTTLSFFIDSEYLK